MALFAQQVTLTGSVQTINFFDLYGLRVLAVGLFNMGGHPMQVSLGGAVPTGNALLLPQTAYMRIGNTGGVESISFQGTAADVLQIFATGDPSDTLPDVVVYNPGGGGGGGGAPVGAQYVLDTATPDPAFTGPVVPLQAMQQSLGVNLQQTAGAPVVDVDYPLRLQREIVGGPNISADGGTGITFSIKDTANPGSIEYGTIQFRRQPVDASWNRLVVTGKGSAPMFRFDTTDTGNPSGFVLENGHDGLVASQGGNALYIGTKHGGGLWITDNGNHIAKWVAQHCYAQDNLYFTAKLNKDIALINGNSDAGINVSDDATRPIQIIAGGTNSWFFRTDGDTEMPTGGRIKNLADGISPTDAATVAQTTKRELFFSGDGIPGGGGAWASGLFCYCRVGSTTGPTGAGVANGALAELCNMLPPGATVRKLTVTVLANTLATLLSLCTVKLRIDNVAGSTTMQVPIDSTMAAGTVHTNSNSFSVPAGSYINVCLDNNVQVDVGALYLAIMVEYSV